MILLVRALDAQVLRISHKLDTVGLLLVAVNCVNLGWCRGTDLFKQTDLGTAGYMAFRFVGRSCEVGSRTLVHEVADAGVESHG